MRSLNEIIAKNAITEDGLIVRLNAILDSDMSSETLSAFIDELNTVYTAQQEVAVDASVIN